MFFHSYAQHNEDVIAAALLGGDTGYYVDVGAHDGITFSNTYAFYQMGWHGVCIEPHPRYFAQLQRNRYRDACLRCAVDNESHLTGVLFEANPLGAFSGLRLTPEMQSRAKTEMRLGGVTGDIEPILVPVLSLRDLLAIVPLPQVDLLTIDVEGIEADVLSGFPFDYYQPRLIIAEMNDVKQLDYVLEANGYSRAFDNSLNAFYTCDDDDRVTIAEASADL